MNLIRLMPSWMSPEFISMSNIVSAPQPVIDKRLPGDLAMWFFILAELTVFAIFFIGFAVTEQLNIELFLQGKAQLHKVAGVINTIALITSSLFVALAVRAIHQKNSQGSIILLTLAQLCSCVYLLSKSWEYYSLFELGITIETNVFFTLYFLITSFHFLHVILGMVILGFIAIKAKNGNYQTDVSGFESGACYWHMVDMVWIILFPLVYVI